MTKNTAHEAFRRALEEAAKVCEREKVDAEYTGHEDRAFNLACDMILAAIGQIPNPYPASEWVKARERLPEPDKTVLWISADGVISTGIRPSHDMWLDIDWAAVEERDFQSTHWMPLPTPPEEKP